MNTPRTLTYPVRSAHSALAAHFLVLLLIVCAWLPAQAHARGPAPAVPFTGVCLVVGVTDGDTLTVRCGVRGAYQQLTVRLGSIDAPEQRQDFGQRAKQGMSDLVYQQNVELACAKADRYGRLVCNVYRDGKDVSLQLVSQGLAWWYRAYSREQTPKDRVLISTQS